MVTIFQKILSFILVFLTLQWTGVTNGYEDEDMKTMTENIISGLSDGSVGPFSGSDKQSADEIISLTAPDGKGGLYFTDIDYENGDRAVWPANRHLTRCERLAILWHNAEDGDIKEQYKTVILGLLDHWLENDYQNSNWWFNRLSNPNILGEIGILIRPELDCKRLFKLSELVSRGSFTVSPTLFAYTGANSTDLAMSTIKFGVLTGSKTAVKTAVKVVSDVLKVTDGEGLNADGTFFQHGKRIYMGGYGVEFISGISKIILMLGGTGLNFTQEQLTPLSHFILDGLQKMSFGKTLDPSTMGRSVSRQNAQPLPGLAPTLRRLADVPGMPRREELLSYAQSIENDTKQDFGVTYFEDGKFLTVNNGGFYFSFKGGDDDIAYAEIINDENVLGYNSSFPGTTTIMRSGTEQTNISPVFDFALVPGATAVYESDDELFAHDDFTYRYLKGKFGGKSDGQNGVIFAKTSHEGIDMTVACFATGNSALLLGAGMRDSKGREMNTCINQTFADGEITRSGGVVIHGGIRYELLSGGELIAKTEHKTGDWHRNNLASANIPAEADIFTVYFKNTGSYAYTVMADGTDEHYEIIENSENIQAALLPTGKIAAVFYKNGSFTFGGETYTGKAGECGIF